MTKPTPRSTDRLAQTVAALARLLDQTMNDIQAFEAELEAAHRGQAATEQQGAERLNSALEEARLSARELERMREAGDAWETEREVLHAECERAMQMVEQLKREHDLALAETEEAAAIALERQIASALERVRAELTAQFEAERATLVADRNRAQQRLADVASEYETKLAEVILKQLAAPAAPKPQSVELETIQAEIARVENAILSIAQIVENPETELSVIIHKNVERAEMESYLRGLRFRIAGA